MALIKDVKGRPKGGGYSRLFQDEDLGFLMSRAHGAVISSGTELESIIKSKVRLITNLDGFLEQEIMQDGVLVVDKKKVKKSKVLESEKAEPDFLIFKRRCGKQSCHVVELKDGDAFDTKKSAAERDALYSFIRNNAQHLQYTMQAHFCCFNQLDKQVILAGFKGKIKEKEAMTGREFCNLLELDYDAILRFRKQQGPENLRYFITELAKIKSVKKVLDSLT